MNISKISRSLIFKLAIIGCILSLLIYVISFTYSANKKARNVNRSYSDDILDVPCEKWLIVTDGKFFRFKYPFSESTAVFDYNTKQDAIDAACRQYKHEKSYRTTVWTTAE